MISMIKRKALLLEIQDDGFIIAAGSNNELLAYEHFGHSIKDGMLVDQSAFLSSVKNFRQQHKVKGRTIRLVLKSKHLIFRFVSFPTMKSNELAFAAKSKMGDLFPIDIKQYVIDYKATETPDGIEVMYAGVPAAMLEGYTAALKDAKQKTIVVDVFQNCIVRCLPQEDYCLLLNLSQNISLTIVEKGRIQTIQELPFNSETTMELNRFLGIRKQGSKVIYMEEKLFSLEEYFKERGFSIQWVDPSPLALKGLILRR